VGQYTVPAEAVTQLFNAVGDDIDKLIDYFVDFYSKLTDRGYNYVKSVLNTLKSRNPSVLNSLRKEWISTHSPEPIYEEIIEEIPNKVREEASKEASVIRAQDTEFAPFLPTRESDFKLINETQVEGFPQGSPISPLLCSMVLGQTLFDQGACTMYADDGLFHGDLQSPGETTQMMKYFGLSFAEDKSGWVKKDGVWLKPLHFLGLEFDPHGNEGLGQLRAKTRSGATLAFDKEQLIVDLMSRLSPEALSELQEPLLPSTHDPVFYSSSDSVNRSKLGYKYFNEFRRKISSFVKRKDCTSADLLLYFSELRLLEKYDDMNLQFSYWDVKLEDLVFSLCAKLDLRSNLSQSQYEHQFDWSLLVKSGQFGFVQSRLYQDSWNSEVEQDFRMSYKPFSWSWFAMSSLIDMSSTSEESYPEAFSLGNRFQKSETTFFNDHVYKEYGYEDVGTFYKLGAKEFFRVLSSKATEDQAIKNRLKIIVTARFNKHLSTEEGHPGFRRFLTVFNSTSHALPCLVNIFRIQRHLSEWRNIFKDKLGLKGKSLRNAVQHLSLGYSPSGLYQRLITNPTMMDHIPSPWSIASSYEPIG
jgi:hypothetical protein